MARSMREAVAHAATPWEWRSRTSVVALVVVAIAIPLASIAAAWTDDDGANRLVALVFYGVLGVLVLVRPALRSLRRWDQNHDAT